ncbi:MAG: S9 family peptidase [Candidatus Dormibacteraeota bacterium]|nr:S9 family peptidase [Candidatus Dormibacteraeota bacterium]MDQ6900858.1 S9 family peptidase [Candidatus Dormibacteraeota bacterium]
MIRTLRRALLLAATGLVASLGLPAAAASPPQTFTGALDKANFQIQVPNHWNGTLVLYSHGYEVPVAYGGSSPATVPVDAADPVSQQWLLDHGYALAASEYSTQGWALEQAFKDQIAVLDHFNTLGFGKPKRVIAWGHSLGGMITAGLLQLHPERFAGAIPMCGVVAGGVAVWNQGLDGEFVFKTLTGPAAAKLKIVDVPPPPDAFANFGLGNTLLESAQLSPQGRARIALAAAVSDTPGWFIPGSAEPAKGDYAAREQNQFLWLDKVDNFFSLALRGEMEARAGGNPSWNTGVDYGRQLARSANRDEVQALYKKAGLSLDGDLDTLAGAARISANPSAVKYLERNIIYNGELDQPVLTMHTQGDGLVLPDDEQAYASVVRSADNSDLLRQTFVHAAGHCNFTPADHIAAFTTLIRRLDTGHWGDTTSAADMNATAASLGLGASAFVSFRPNQFLRPFDVRNLDRE